MGSVTPPIYGGSEGGGTEEHRNLSAGTDVTFTLSCMAELPQGARGWPRRRHAHVLPPPRQPFPEWGCGKDGRGRLRPPRRAASLPPASSWLRSAVWSVSSLLASIARCLHSGPLGPSLSWLLQADCLLLSCVSAFPRKAWPFQACPSITIFSLNLKCYQL